MAAAIATTAILAAVMLPGVQQQGEENDGRTAAMSALPPSTVSAGRNVQQSTLSAVPRHTIRIQALASDGVAPPPPAPTPAPVPTEDATVVGADRGACPELIYAALGRPGCMISFCESMWDPNAIGLEGELGWFQVHPRWHADATLDPAGNVAAAVRISRGGTYWFDWTTRGVLWSGVCPNGVRYPE